MKMSQKLIRVASNIESAKRSKLSTTLILKTHSTALYICTNCTNLNALRSVQMVRNLKPLQNPKGNIWYSGQPVGHNKLSSTVGRLCEQAGIEGFFTNHSLRTSAATRLCDAGVDEQLIMLRTGHRSTAGVRSYKRATEALKKQTSRVLNDCSNLKKPRLDEPVESKTGSPEENKLQQARTDTENTGTPHSIGGNVFQFQGSSNITFHFSVPQ